jgi:hypothetical protein
VETRIVDREEQVCSLGTGPIHQRVTEPPESREMTDHLDETHDRQGLLLRPGFDAGGPGPGPGDSGQTQVGAPLSQRPGNPRAV